LSDRSRSGFIPGVSTYRAVQIHETTSVSTLALGSIVTFFAIVAGAWATMKVHYWRIRQNVDAHPGRAD
jgi:hypothetical protein